ncbi:ISLre2 family transposase [Carboxydochorda subterranea]|uniref:ISLre2 family transposase n=1 Tax=Carboxydichorda subterranea TaxID=3109565 RepID=A0ABZ1BU21_9FIRM|nr:ISLre2 family transposase [Limnochorda sp. L945t]WRP16083.1 ISLre2 family transposase [Limnochorda sp. L945t]
MVEAEFILPRTIRSFKDLERFVWQVVRQAVAEAMEAACRGLDEVVKGPGPGWESVGYQRRTVMGLGGVEYRLVRRVYRRRAADGSWEYRCPLDKALGLPAEERFSPLVQERAVALATRMSFRKAAQVLQDEGIPVSAQTVHQWVQEAGAARESQERAATERIAATGELPASEGRSATAVVVEVDGVWLALQRAKAKRWEFKVGVMHEGWVAEDPRGRRFRLQGKQAWGGDLETEPFWERGFVRFTSRYTRGQVQRLVGNSDGAAWAQAGREWLGIEEWHLDPFHRNEALERVLGWETRLLRRAQKAARRGDWAALEGVLEQAKVHPDRAVPVEAIEQVKAYLAAHREGLVDWRRMGRPLPRVARSLGAAEPTIRHLINARMKHIGGGWSRRGAHHMILLRCLGHEQRLESWLAEWTAGVWQATSCAPVLQRLARHIRRRVVEGAVQQRLQAHVPLLSHPEARRSALGDELRRRLSPRVWWAATV